MAPRDGRPDGRRLVLLRHAKAEPAGAVADELRPLTLTGRRQSAGVGAALAASGLVPDHVLVSSAVRTRQTWELVRGSLGAKQEPGVDVTDQVYEARASDILELVRAVDERVGTLLVVGHEPTMSGATAVLAGREGDATHRALVSQVRTGLPTGAYAVLEVDRWADVAAGAARLVAVVRPSG
ncbi:MAG: putative phosphohistidine phosphatase, SixA [Actinotalea sp.]|nr:putative phosphohistidine phosphatase, SixA [Actinotalea sp.]